MFDLKKLYTGNLEWLADHTILFGLAGSKSYGLDTPESDTDLKGLCIPPVNYFYGWLNNFEQAERKKQDDDIEFVVYDIRKFFNLAANANPNILELLFLDPADYLIMTELGERLIANRDKFLSRKVVHTYSGYAHSQLQKHANNVENGKPIRTKHALHLVRLLIQAKEILTTGKLIVKRPDREFLLSIRNGAWTYDQLIEWSSAQEAEIMKLAETSTLPHSPDRVFLDQLCIDMVDQFMRSR